MKKPHLYFKNTLEGSSILKPRPGGGRKEEREKDDSSKDYSLMASTFSDCLDKFDIALKERVKNRTIDAINYFDAIELNFFAGFKEANFKAHYIDYFGLVLLRLTHFNRKGLFAIENVEKFHLFLDQLNFFIENQKNNTEEHYDTKIRFIKSFKLYSTDDRVGNIDNYEVIHMSFMGIGSFLEKGVILNQKKSLINFLNDRKIKYVFDEQFGEVYNINEKTLRFILDNFDFIYATCSGSGAIITPSKYNIPIRGFGFKITNTNQDLPIIGVIDTGVSNKTPLASLLIGTDGEYDTTGTGSFNDNTDHGTGVAAFAAFGNKLIPNYKGDIEADAKILPIKILDNNRGAISQKKTVDLIRKAHLDYGVRIFTLTIGYTFFPLKDNEEFSSYATMLDKVAAELDILIFISTTNHIFDNLSVTDYPEKFKICNANIAPPAESMNNITIGATANNFEDYNMSNGLAGNASFPAMYSRKFHYDFEDTDIFNQVTINPFLRKPDLVIGGGDYGEELMHGMSLINDQGESCIEVLSSDLSIRTFKALGTSYSTPLAANLAAQFIKIYPDLNMQSIKALLINSSTEIKLESTLNGFSKSLRKRVMGYGELNNQLLFSSEDKVTMIIEDSITYNRIKLFPLHLPEYLNRANRMKGLLKFTATLCFKFQPKTDNQLLYCPIHLSYVIGKNVPLEQTALEEKVSNMGEVFEAEVPSGYNGSKSEKYKLGDKGWVQDYYFLEKIVSNVQRHCFKVKRQDIIDERNTFKIAINAAFQKTLTEAEKKIFDNEIPFSLVITIEQQPLKKEKLNSLYDGLIAINELEAIGQIELEAEL